MWSGGSGVEHRFCSSLHVGPRAEGFSSCSKPYFVYIKHGPGELAAGLGLSGMKLGGTWGCVSIPDWVWVPVLLGERRRGTRGTGLSFSGWSWSQHSEDEDDTGSDSC